MKSREEGKHDRNISRYRIKAVTIDDTHIPFFSGVPQPEQADMDGFNAYIKQFRALLDVERTAVAVI
ncbi:MAG: hypothetical protein ACI4PL_03650 [Faecousia sp.]